MITRRLFTRGLLGTGLGGLAPRFAQAQVPAQGGEMVFCSWGGAYQDAIRRAWIEPFVQRTGARVREDTNPELARIKAMVDTSTVSWDVVTGGGSTLMEGAQQGLFEPIPASVVR